MPNRVKDIEYTLQKLSSSEVSPQDGSLFVLACVFKGSHHRLDLFSKHLKAASA